MLRTTALVLISCVALQGCEAIAEMHAKEMARQQALREEVDARMATLNPQDRNAVQKCSSRAVGKFATLRNADQISSYNIPSDYTILYQCLNNPYYYETIPAPTQRINCMTQSDRYGNAWTQCN